MSPVRIPQKIAMGKCGEWAGEQIPVGRLYRILYCYSTGMKFRLAEFMQYR
jgi:hypothetical protein